MLTRSFHCAVAALTFCETVTAIPSIQIPYQTQRPLSLQLNEPQTSWRTFSDSIIRKIWGNSDGGKIFTSKHTMDSDGPIPASKSRYGEDIVLRFNLSTSEEARKLAEVANFMYLDIWDSTSDWADIRLSKDVLPHVLNQLPESMQHAHFALLQEKELQQAILDSYPSAQGATLLSHPDLSRHDHFTSTPRPISGPHTAADNNIFFSNYQPLSVIQPWMRLLASLFTTHVRLISVGQTYEGRDIPGFRIGVHPAQPDEPVRKRKTVLIFGGLHAREWISVSTVTYIAYSLITSYGKLPEITQLLEDFDWVLIPTLNPDGYEHTWSSDRLWRKNRQKTPLRFCFGVDLDRTFPFEWDSSTVGNPCVESYAGEAPLEGVEAQALQTWVRNETQNNNVEFVGLLDLHSYSQQILYPYSYSCEAYPPSLENLEELALGLSKAIRIQSGHSYMSKQACEGNVATAKDGKKKDVAVRFESAGGTALDWFYHEIGIRYAYQIKLRDRGAYGFLLPKEHIVPTGQEVLEAVLYFGRYVDGEFEELDRGETGRRPRRLRSQSGW